jgi:exopolyphosphatase/guanosine-5'-triphosphate,3'-diphosphate pyrophosphatase
MALACIDVGSNTTRLLVADAPEGRLRELLTQRVFTRIGKSMGKGNRIPPEKVAECAEVIARQASLATDAGAETISLVGTAAVRDAANRDELAAASERAAGIPMRVLSEEEEAKLAFVGATKTLGAPVEGTVAVVDVGGGSTEIAIGTVAEGVTWWASFRIGSGFLADSYLRADPPAASELHAVRVHVAGVFEGLARPSSDRAVAVGGSATSLRRLVGTELAYESLERSVRILAGAPADEVAARFELDPERVRLLPAGVLIFEALTSVLGHPLMIGKGGLREGIILEQLAP